MSIGIIDYGAGNIGSVINMFRRLGIEASLVSRAADMARHERLLLPGVGAFDHCIASFNTSGMRDALEDAVHAQKKPLLGICVGLQMLFEDSEEGKMPGLGWIKGHIRRFRLNNPVLKVPHMGWNDVHPVKPCSLFDGMETDARFYFVHSYYPVCDNPADILAEADYGGRFCCAASVGNIGATQFHPEKSHRFGMRLLKNFSTWTPAA